MAAVRTSITDRPSSDRIDDFTDERERKRLDNLPLVLDEDFAMVRRECGHDVLSLQSTEYEILGAVEFDATVGIHLADERDAPYSFTRLRLALLLNFKHAKLRWKRVVR